MASVLKVDSITGVTTAGSISVTGEGNSTTTNLQQGLAKAWSSLDSSGGSTATQHDSVLTSVQFWMMAQGSMVLISQTI